MSEGIARMSVVDDGTFHNKSQSFHLTDMLYTLEGVKRIGAETQVLSAICAEYPQARRRRLSAR
jgi:hypothetical protein